MYKLIYLHMFILATPINKLFSLQDFINALI